LETKTGYWTYDQEAVGSTLGQLTIPQRLLAGSSHIYLSSSSII